MANPTCPESAASTDSSPSSPEGSGGDSGMRRLDPGLVEQALASRTVQCVALKNRSTARLATHQQQCLVGGKKVAGCYHASQNPGKHPDSHWHLVPLPGQPFVVVLNHQSRQVISVVGKKTRAADVGLLDTQLWQVLPVGDGFYVLKNKVTGLILGQRAHHKSVKAKYTDELDPRNQWEVLRISHTHH